jgi:hypothetical protein
MYAVCRISNHASNRGRRIPHSSADNSAQGYTEDDRNDDDDDLTITLILRTKFPYGSSVTNAL